MKITWNSVPFSLRIVVPLYLDVCVCVCRAVSIDDNENDDFEAAYYVSGYILSREFVLLPLMMYVSHAFSFLPSFFP